MRVECPNCSQLLDADEAHAGQIVKCAFCGREMRLPGEPPPSPPAGRSDQAVEPTEFRGAGVEEGRKRCPHCGEAVEGTEARCPHCDIVFDPDRQGESRDGPLWEQRSRLGWWPALWGTFKGAMFDPVRTFDRVRLTDFGPALGYSAVSALIGSFFGAIYYLLMNTPQLLVMASTGGGPGGGGGPGAAVMVGMILGMALFNFAIGFGAHLVWVLMFAGMNHLGLIIFKSAREGFVTTFRATAYAYSSAHFWNVVPMCGGLVGLVWGVIASILALARTHRIEYGKATLAVLIPLGSLFLLFVGAVVIFVVLMYSALR